jgi:hypothetical protein
LEFKDRLPGVNIIQHLEMQITTSVFSYLQTHYHLSFENQLPLTVYAEDGREQVEKLINEWLTAQLQPDRILHWTRCIQTHEELDQLRNDRKQVQIIQLRKRAIQLFIVFGILYILGAFLFEWIYKTD